MEVRRKRHKARAGIAKGAPALTLNNSPSVR
jgi:hypothetical protein